MSDVASGPRHLATRFLGSLSPAPPAIADENWADAHLTPGERLLWTQMSNQDRRHSVGVARRFAQRRAGADRAEIAGALLHDVGKIESRLGTFGRVVATLIGPRTERFRRYDDHEAIGARLLAHAGSEPATIDLVGGRSHASADLRICDF